jgi:HSP20 family protein
MFGLTPWRRNPQGGSLATRRGHPLEQLRDEFDALFDHLAGGRWPLWQEGESGVPRLWGFDVDERDNEILVKAEMPGFEPGDLDVQIRDNQLMIQAERKQESEAERQYSSFRRSVTLPAGIDPDKVQASYRNGLLELHIPRTQTSQGKRIPIQGQPAAAAGSTPARTAPAQAGPGQTSSGGKASAGR